MFAYFRRSAPAPRGEGGELYTSADGVRWRFAGPTGPCGDNTCFFRDPFRGLWVWSVRSYDRRGRVRSRHASPRFVGGAGWRAGEPAPWLAADELDRPDPALGYPPQLYKVSAVAYEGLLVGLFGIFEGPPNEEAARLGVPKTIDLHLGWSRDGIAWQRPWREPLIACSRRPGDWNRGYLHAAGGQFLVVRDELWFYFGAWSGRSPRRGGDLYAGGSTGLAVLRRDGFASLDADGRGGTLHTRPLTFRGRHLFANVDLDAAPAGELSVEIVDGAGRAIGPFTRAACVPQRAGGTRVRVDWRGAADLGRVAGRPVHLRFHLRGGRLYSFWVSPGASGASGGHVAAGGPGFAGGRDGAG
jgi:hypothetical protein